MTDTLDRMYTYKGEVHILKRYMRFRDDDLNSDYNCMICAFTTNEQDAEMYGEEAYAYLRDIIERVKTLELYKCPSRESQYRLLEEVLKDYPLNKYDKTLDVIDLIQLSLDEAQTFYISTRLPVPITTTTTPTNKDN